MLSAYVIPGHHSCILVNSFMVIIHSPQSFLTPHQPEIEFQIAKSIGPTLPLQTKLSYLICQHTVNAVCICHTRPSFMHTSQFIHGCHSFTPVILNTHRQPPIKLQIAKSIAHCLEQACLICQHTLNAVCIHHTSQSLTHTSSLYTYGAILQVSY